MKLYTFLAGVCYILASARQLSCGYEHDMNELNVVRIELIKTKVVIVNI
jgi:hypothetical protein